MKSLIKHTRAYPSNIKQEKKRKEKREKKKKKRRQKWDDDDDDNQVPVDDGGGTAEEAIQGSAVCVASAGSLVVRVARLRPGR